MFWKNNMKNRQNIDLNHARYLLDNNGPGAMYNYMESHGYDYPRLANGLVNGDSLAAKVAVRHMIETAEENGVTILDPDNPIDPKYWKDKVVDISVVRDLQADGYLTTIMDKHSKRDYTEVTAGQADKFHSDQFKKIDLPPETWTLNPTFAVANEGEQQALWNASLAAAGDPNAELVLSLSTFWFMSEKEAELAHEYEGYIENNTEQEHPELYEKISDINDWKNSNVFSTENILDVLGGLGDFLFDAVSEASESIKDSVFEVFKENWFDDAIKRFLGEDRVNDFWNRYFDMFDRMNDPRVKDSVNDRYGDASKFIFRRDPLTLDLDGDGIETISANAGIVFDFDGDGTRTGTGWVKGDDGFVVLDLNNNGTIDNGSELFGVDTVKRDGKLAIDGFDALRELDSNSDGMFDIQDDQFSKVQIWQDLNQDGISQVHELKSLADLSITAINLTAKKTNLGSNGNLISAVGNYIREDGTTGEANANQSLAANLDLAENPFYREFTDKITLSESVEALPDMNGSGAVRDLQEAAMLNPLLEQVLTTYAQAATRDEQLALLDQIISQWANSAQNYKDFSQRINALDVSGVDIQYVGGGNVSLLERIRVLEVFNSQNFLDFRVEHSDKGLILVSRVGATVSRSVLNIRDNVAEVSGNQIDINWGQMSLLNQAYESLRQSIYDGLLLQTRLEPHLDKIELLSSEKGISFNFDKVHALFQAIYEVDNHRAIQDILDFYRITEGSLISKGWDGLTQLRDWLANSDSASELYNVAKEMGYILRIGTDAGSGIDGTTSADLLVGSSGDDVLNGSKGNDTLYGGGGNDTYVFELGSGHDRIIETHGVAGTDILQFGSGISVGDLIITVDGNHLVIKHYTGYDSITVLNWFNSANDTNYRIDTLKFADGTTYDLSNLKLGTDQAEVLIGKENGNTSQDILVGGSGNDQLIGNDGNDWLDGGVGADTLIGGTGNDIYVVDSSGDVVVEDADAGIDTIETHINTTLVDNVENLTLVGANNLRGTGNTLDNVIIGNAGSNTLFGLEGNDTLIGNLGNDTLDGGTGADIMRGGAGNDSYIVDHTDDIVTELLNQGTDTVISSINYSLNDNVENLNLTGTAVNGSGNSLNNVIVGNSLENTLLGLDGNDTLDGGAGADTLFRWYR